MESLELGNHATFNCNYFIERRGEGNWVSRETHAKSRIAIKKLPIEAVCDTGLSLTCRRLCGIGRSSLVVGRSGERGKNGKKSGVLPLKREFWQV